MAQCIKHRTLDLSSGIDLKVVSSKLTLGSTLDREPPFKKKKKRGKGRETEVKELGFRIVGF